MGAGYTLVEHMHRFGAWAASRAASVKLCRFSVQVGRSLIERGGLRSLVLDPDGLPDPGAFDSEHRQWRRALIDAGVDEGLLIPHGIAAKLVNVYMKATVLPASSGLHPKVLSTHPPIDALLLRSLAWDDRGGEVEQWRQPARTRWSKLDCEQYEAVIAGIRRALPIGAPLWMVEEYWKGYQ